MPRLLAGSRLTDGTVNIVPSPRTTFAKTASTLTEEEFFSSLDKLKPGTSDRLIAFLNSCADLQLNWEVKKTLVAHHADLHQTYLSGVEGGKRNPSILVLERLATALGVDIDELFRKQKSDKSTTRHAKDGT